MSELTADQVKAVREKYGISTFEVMKAHRIAEERFDGDLQLGVWWIDAAALAVNVRGDRAAWNDNYARRRVAEEAEPI